jgi:hypothetical protein
VQCDTSDRREVSESAGRLDVYGGWLAAENPTAMRAVHLLFAGVRPHTNRTALCGLDDVAACAFDESQNVSAFLLGQSEVIQRGLEMSCERDPVRVADVHAPM